jgi:hypothetical protein
MGAGETAEVHLPHEAWHVVGGSVRGASHVRSGLENQDAIEWSPVDGAGSQVVLSVADGHGSPRSFRSAVGARLANRVSCDLALELLAAALDGGEFGLLKGRLEQDAPKRLVRDWRRAVEDDLDASPFTEAELAAAVQRDGQSGPDRLARDPYVAYGTTLITAVASSSFVAFWQIGDGDLLAVSDTGQVGRPLVRDALLIGNETTSLCSENAWRLFHVAAYRFAAPLMLLSTDGFSNSYVSEEGFLRFGADLHQMIVSDGLDAVAGRLDGWLRELTEGGSGDDITLGILCQPAALRQPEFLASPLTAHPIPSEAVQPPSLVESGEPEDARRAGVDPDSRAAS